MAKNNEWKGFGRLGQDSVDHGKFTTFSIAIWTGKDKPPLWLNILSFHDTQYKKGDEVMVTGRLDMSKKDDKQYWQVVADEIELKSKPKDDDFLEE